MKVVVTWRPKASRSTLLQRVSILFIRSDTSIVSAEERVYFQETLAVTFSAAVKVGSLEGSGCSAEVRA